MPKRDTHLPQALDLYMPFDETLHPGERASVNLELSFKWPENVCGIVMLKRSAAAKLILRMNPILVGKF